MRDVVQLPDWWQQLLFTLIVLGVAVLTTIIVFRKRHTVIQAGTHSGTVVLGVGLWLLVLVYLLDFVAAPDLPGATSLTFLTDLLARQAELRWYVAASANALLLIGFALVVVSLGRRYNAAVEEGRALRKNETLYESIFDNIPLGLIVKDRNSVIRNVNRTYLDWYGLTREEIVGQQTNRAQSYKFDVHMRSAADLERDCLETGAIGFHQIARTFATGDLHTIRVTKFPIHDEGGAIDSVGSVSVDMTEYLNAKFAAEAARQEAEAASNAKSSFLATMSHEFRTPLNAIIGFSSMLDAQVFGPLGSGKYKEYAQGINTSGSLMLDLVNDVLDISEIEAGMRSLNFEELDLEQIITECLSVLNPIFSEKSISVSLNAMPRPLVFVADRRSTKQILVNILSNAAKFGHRGGRINISVAERGREFALRIKDDGPGISEERLEKIVEPFYRGEVDPHVAQQGTGLGLSIVKTLVELNCGRLEIDSTPGKGTTVTIYLPYAQAAGETVETGKIETVAAN